MRMKEDEIAALEKTAEDYGLNDYPINGAQLSALIASYRHYEKLAKLAAPTMEAAYRRNLARKVNDRYMTPRAIVLFLTIGAGALLAILMQKYGMMLTPGTDPWTAILSVFFMIVLPVFIIFIPAMKWLDRKASAYYDTLENKELEK